MSAPNNTLGEPIGEERRISRLVSTVVPRTLMVVGFVLCFLAIAWLASFRNALLFTIGAGLGASLVYFGIGFAGPWRSFMVRRKAKGLVANLFMLALASLVFIPVLQNLDGVVSNAAPLGISVLIGAFLFGIGMQLGGGCGSGTLVGAGAGSRHSLWVLAFFLPGSLLGSLHLPWWLNQPRFGQVVLADYMAYPLAALLQVAALAVIAVIVIRIARKTGDNPIPSNKQFVGCAVIVLLALATLYISGRMWSITFAYGLWGAKIVEMAGVDLSTNVFWSSPYPANALANTVLADVTSVMNFGLLAGVAMLTIWKLNPGDDQSGYPLKRFYGAAIAGLLMGYGARLAFGCNIGALFSGLASGSMHAWLWFAAAWVGCHLGIKLRPRFAMAN